MDDQKVLKILVITSRPLVDSENRHIHLLDVEQERERIRGALQKAGVGIHAHFLANATVGAVTRAFAQDWDVVHITGHGSRDGNLLLEDEYGVAQFLNARDVVALMGASLPRVVVLSLCYAGKALPDTLLDTGVETVIAIDADEPIPDHAAILFNETFYSLLARGESVGKAFERAQTRVRLDGQVGDKAFAASGEKGPPYSERFTLVGDDAFAFASETGAYQETGTPRALGNLRERNRDFVGRAHEIVQIVQAFDARGMQANARRVALHSAGGLGKTELAQAVAWWYAERGRVDAVVWASASPTEYEFVLRDLASFLAIAARALKLNFSEQMPFDEQKAIVREALSAQETFLLLDNWETLVENKTAREVWNFVLNLPPRVRVLVASRHKLPPKDAENIELETLAPDDAAKLFLNIARNTGYFKNNPQLSAEETAILSAIIERLGGYALAIEVVAGQTESRSLSAIWHDLVQIPKNVLEGKTEFGEPRGVWTSLDFSYNVLPNAEKEMFCRMSAFLVPAMTDDIAALTTIPEPRSVLDTLVKRSLVRFREGHYSLLPIVREYAESKLMESQVNLVSIHLTFGKYFADKETDFGKLIASEHLYYIAMRFQNSDAAEKFIGYVKGFYQSLSTHGHWFDAQYKLQQVITLAEALDNKREKTWALREMGSLQIRLGNYDIVLDFYLRTRDLAHQLDFKDEIALANWGIGSVYARRGNFADAEVLFRQALVGFQELGHKKSEISILAELARMLDVQGKFDEAEPLFARCLKSFRELGSRVGEVSTLHSLANLKFRQKYYREAEQLYYECLKISEELQDKNAMARTKQQLGLIAFTDQQYDLAKHLLQESLKLKEELGDKDGIASALHNLAVVAEKENDFDTSIQLYFDSLELKEQLGEKEGTANTLRQLGVIAQSEGRLNLAFSYCLKALNLSDELHSPSYLDAQQDLKKIYCFVGEKLFFLWLKQVYKDNQQLAKIVESTKNCDVEVDSRHTQILQPLAYNVELVVSAMISGVAERIHDLRQQIDLAEEEMKKRDEEGLARFFEGLRSLLDNHDIEQILASLLPPFRGLLAEARDRIRSYKIS